MTDPLKRLSDLNRDEWKNRPYLIELLGGPRCGKRYTHGDLPLIWREPTPEPFTLINFPSPFSSVAQMTLTKTPIADYRATRSVTNTGARIYEFVRYE
jgi:hypothetical protein